MAINKKGLVSWGLMGSSPDQVVIQVPDKINLSLAADGPLEITLSTEALDLTVTPTEGGWFGLPGQYE